MRPFFFLQGVVFLNRFVSHGLLYTRQQIGDGMLLPSNSNPVFHLNLYRSQFARRDAVYYHPNTVRSQDAFLIICTIAASPTPPVPIPSEPMKSVPKDLLDAVGNLLDDPVYSDVEFILPSRYSSLSKPKARTIWAARRLLKRADYFKNSKPVPLRMQ
jgi:hypothetical protein